jgi:hypothetical protein
MRRNVISLLFLCGLFITCSSETDPAIGTADILGKWKLVAELLDPGDGSGEYKSVVSDRTVEFFANGTYTSSEPLCPDFNSGNSLTGTYSYDKSSNEWGSLIPDECTFFGDGRTIVIKIEAQSLILGYPCIEACRYKYSKIESVDN